jgi:hypothetical protein
LFRDAVPMSEVALFESMSGVAAHTLAGHINHRGAIAMPGTYGTCDPARHPLVDSCHPYAAESEIVRKLRPGSYPPRGRNHAA